MYTLFVHTMPNAMRQMISDEFVMLSEVDIKS